MRQLNFLLLACYIGAMTNGYVSSLMSSLITNPRWTQDLKGLSNPTLLGFVVAAQPLGCIAAFVPAPWLSDKYGRRTGIAVGSVGMLAGFFGQIFCKNATQFLIMRLVVGFASIFNTLSSSALVLELAHPRQRAVMGALFNTFWLIGSMIAAWIAFGTLRISSSWSWRLPVALQVSWSIAQLTLVIWCPESPRWLVSVGRKEQAKAVLSRYHANGDHNDQLVLSEYSSICASTEVDQHTRTASWPALFSTPGNRRRLLLSIVIGVATQWVGNGIIVFYLAPVLRTIGIESASKQQGINGGLQIYTWILAFGAALLSERVGRRRLFLTSVGTMLLFMSTVATCAALYASTKSMTASYAVIICLFLFYGGYVMGLTPIPILYVNEIWPSHLRAKGTSVFWLSQAVATCFNQYVNPVALQRLLWKYYLVYVGVLVALLLFMFFYVPETKGLSLEEVHRTFDKQPGDEVMLDRVSARERHDET
jgi:sugar porter (SP) family MFS transporter